MDDKNIKSNLKKKRQQAGLSQETMAEKLNMARISYLHMESGDTKLINDKLFKAAEVLECKPEELVLGYEPSKLSEEKIRDVQSEVNKMEETIARLEAENEALREKCRMLQEQNDLKTEIITMLKNNR